MTSKSKSLTRLLAAIIVIAALAYVAVAGVTIGKTTIGGVATDNSGIKLGLDLKGGAVIVFRPSDGANASDEQINTVISILRTRLDNQGYTEATITSQTTQTEKRIRIEIPDVSDLDEAIDKIGTTAELNFVDSDGTVVLSGKTGVKTASYQHDSQQGNYVQLELTSEGRESFAEATGRVAGTSNNYISIVMDETVISSPLVDTRIDSDTCVITGDFDAEYAAWLADIIKSGQLPFSLEVCQSEIIGATLGERAYSTSLQAMLWGVILVLLFMLLFYRVPGFIADISLIAYIAIIAIVLSALGINLTLPGIAGIVLSIGMAVDANIIIFERVKEELAAGKTVGAAVESGFKRAFTAILDGNITTIIAAVVLYFCGTGTIKGFAITLGVGIVVSMFTAVVLTRFLLKQLVGLNIRNPKLYGASLRGGKADA